MRGEIYWADLHPRSGSEQSGRRPVILISHDLFNLSPSWQSLVVIPMTTSSRQANRGPSNVSIPGALVGLPKDGLAICHQITTLDRSKLIKRIGSLPGPLLKRVEEGIKAAIDLD
jgi:mRNA interferase MazF